MNNAYGGIYLPLGNMNDLFCIDGSKSILKSTGVKFGELSIEKTCFCFTVTTLASSSSSLFSSKN